MAGVRRGLQNRCWSVPPAKVGSIPTLSATSRVSRHSSQGTFASIKPDRNQFGLGVSPNLPLRSYSVERSSKPSRSLSGPVALFLRWRSPSVMISRAKPLSRERFFWRSSACDRIEQAPISSAYLATEIGGSRQRSRNGRPSFGGESVLASRASASLPTAVGGHWRKCMS